jgi:hypothetical protein
MRLWPLPWFVAGFPPIRVFVALVAPLFMVSTSATLFYYQNHPDFANRIQPLSQPKNLQNTRAEESGAVAFGAEE